MTLIQIIFQRRKIHLLTSTLVYYNHILYLYSHLSPGQTIRSTRGFKWNTGQNNGQQVSEPPSTSSNPLFTPPLQPQQQTSPFENQNNSGTNISNNNISTPQRQVGSPRGKIQQQKVTDFNYTPSHQKNHFYNLPQVLQ